MLVMKYPNVLTGAFTTSETRDSLAVPCRGATHVVMRGRSSNSETVPTSFIFLLGNGITQTFVSTGGQGYLEVGTWPVNLNQAGGQTRQLYCSDGGGARRNFYHDFVKARITAAAAGLTAGFALDLEVYYDFDAVQMLLMQLGVTSYTPV